jgi:predicted dehydrogenase
LLKVSAATGLHATGAPFVRADAHERIRVGQIGTRHSHAEGKMATMRKLADLFDVVGIVEPNAALRGRAEQRDTYAGLRWMTEAELLATPGLDAVVVENDIPELTPTGVRCLRAGKHIHLDKPPGESLDAYRALHGEAAERKRVVQLGYMFRYNAAFQFVFRAVREGWLGDITEIHGQIGKYASPELRRELARFPGGGMFELGCHLVDAAVAVLGAPDRVHAVNNRTDTNDTAADNQLAVLEYAKAIATIRCNHVDRLGFQRREFTVVGTNGVARINPLEPPQLELTLASPAAGYTKGAHAIDLPKSDGRYDEDFRRLARAIRGQEPLGFDHTHDLAVHETLLKICVRSS